MVTAAVLAGAAGALLPRDRSAVLARLAGGPRRRRLRRPVLAVVASAVAYAVVGILPVLLALLLGALGRWQLRRRNALREADRRRAALGELLSALVAELRSGADPRPAVLAAATGLSGLEAVVTAAARSSGDVAGALVALAGEPGGSTAGELAAVWRVGEMTGAGLAGPAARVLRGHRGQDRLRHEVAAQLAGPTATAYLLSALPLVGIAMGTALGADPVGFLLSTASGQVVLVVGVAMDCAGFAWTSRIVAAASSYEAGAGAAR